MRRCLGAEAVPGWMGLDAGIHAVVAPALVALAQIEELARRVAVAIEVDFQRGLLRLRERTREVASSMEQAVESGRELGVVRYLIDGLARTREVTS